MHKLVNNGMPRSKAPISNTVNANGRIYSVQIPRDPETAMPSGHGDIHEQTHRVLRQLRKSMEAAGGTLADVAQVLIYLVNSSDAAGMNEVYAEYFNNEPYPNRATVIVKELLGEGHLIEIVVHGHV
jgi:enamine deaminase RidA (YjgF/YER057c/UK114 family)